MAFNAKRFFGEEGALGYIKGTYDEVIGTVGEKATDAAIWGVKKIGVERSEKIAAAVTSPLAKKIGVGAAITAGLGATAYGIHSAYDYLDKKF